MAENAPPGWYQAETDAPGTERYWDGTQWSAETRAAMAPPPSADAAPMAPGDRMTPHGRVLASPWARIGARLLDGLLLAIVLVPIGVWGLDLDVAESAGSFSVRTPSAGALILIAVLGAAYEIIFTALRSATPGKMAVGIEIVRQSDGHAPLGFGTAAQRWLPNVVNNLNANLGSLVTLASLVLVFADRLRRSVFDFVGQTYVVNKLR